MARDICCGVVNRGAAYGHVLWAPWMGASSRSTPNGAKCSGTWTPGSPTGPTDHRRPRVVEDLVVVGNAGADLGACGYVSAYHAATGEIAWRTYTVPGHPADGFESEALARAAETRTANGGRPVAVAPYGTPSPTTPSSGCSTSGQVTARRTFAGCAVRRRRQPLPLADPPSARYGELVWHYQTTPGDTLDYTATQDILLADLEIDGRLRKVLMQAPKNGFFFVLDRATGEYRREVHRGDLGVPRRRDGPSRRDRHRLPQSREVRPTEPYGAHSWPPMSFHPNTGLVYFPVRNMGSIYKMNPTGTIAPAPGTPGSTWRSTRTSARARTPSAGKRSCSGVIRSPRRRSGASPTSRPSTAVRSRPATTCSSRAPPTGASSPTAPRPARRSGSLRSAPA